MASVAAKGETVGHPVSGEFGGRDCRGRSARRCAVKQQRAPRRVSGGCVAGFVNLQLRAGQDVLGQSRIDHLADAYGRAHHSPVETLPLLDRPRHAAAAVHGEPQQRAGNARIAVPQQGDSRARGYLPGVARPIHGRAAQRIGVQVEPPGGDVLTHGLEIAQYRVLRALARGLDGKFRQPLDQRAGFGAHRALELQLPRMRDSERERNIGDPGVALAQRKRLRELVEFVAGHFVRGVEQPAQRVEHVPVGADSRLHVVGDADRDGPEPRACFLPHLDAEVIRAGGGKREARREHGPAQPPVAHRQLLQPCDRIHLRVIECGHGYSLACGAVLDGS